MARWFDDSENESTLPVRAIIAVLFTVGIIAGFFMGKLSSEAFQNLALLALTWYFAKRNTLDQVARDAPGTKQPPETLPPSQRSSSAYTPPAP